MKHPAPLLLGLLLLLAAPAAHAQVAVYASPSDDTWINDVQSKILATGLFNTVDTWSVKTSTPTLGELQSYSAVLVFSDASLYDNVALGNVLADYMDAGGGVVLATFVFHSGGLAIDGRILADGYLPFTMGSQSSGTLLTLVADQPNHPLLAGVSSFNGGTASFHNSSINTAAGATQVAHWDNNLPVVSYIQPTAGICVGLNFYPPSSDARSDFWSSATNGGALMANALAFAAGGAAVDNDNDGYTMQDGDCNDSNPAIHPGATEVCNGADDNCDGVLPQDESDDADFDGYVACEDCDDTDANTYPGATEDCDGVDNNCDGALPQDENDPDNDGWSECEGDCGPNDPDTYPGATELCDGVDNDCDPQTLEGVDDDNDGFTGCDGDCDDGNAMVNPDAIEICMDGADNDCDGHIDAADPDCGGSGDDDDATSDDDDDADEDDDDDSYAGWTGSACDCASTYAAPSAGIVQALLGGFTLLGIRRRRA